MEIIRLLTILLVLVSGCVTESTNPEVFFCPEDQCENRIISIIQNADDSIDVAMYSFTAPKITDALIQAQQRGVGTRIVLDYLQSTSKYSQKDSLSSKIPVRVMRPGKTMHNKFVIVDNQLVVTGSYNFTKNGNGKNYENFILIFDEETISLYKDEFFELWVEAG